MIINITPTGVLESTIMYGIVHGFWLLLKRVGREAYREVRKERNRIIRHHVKTGHGDQLKHCADLACASLRKPVQQEPLQELHTEL